MSYVLPFYHPNCLKNWNKKKNKKTSRDIILYKCTKNHDHMLYCSWDIACDECYCYFSFWAIFFPFTTHTAQKKKTPGDIIIDQIMYSSWDMVHSRWTDGWTEKWKKWHIEVGAPPNNYHRCYENTFIFHVKANQKKLISCKIKLLEWSL